MLACMLASRPNSPAVSSVSIAAGIEKPPADTPASQSKDRSKEQKRQSEHAMGLLSKLSIGAIDLPVGPQADARELEYICCLLQTALPDLRDDATISATDIRLYLRSRYGLSVTPDVAIDIVNGLGGGDDERRRRRRHMLRQQHRHQRNASDVEGCDLVGGDDDEASDAHAPTQDDVVVEDSKPTNDKPCEQEEADEEMGLFESARASGVIDSNNTGKAGTEKESLPNSSSRQSSLFFDVMESATDIGVGIDTPDGDDQEADKQVEAGPNDSSSISTAALEVNTDLEQSIMTTDDSKRRVQWSKKFPSVSRASESESPPPVPPSSTNASDNREVYLDLVEVLGAILIPTLIKSKREADIANGCEEDPSILVPDNPEVSFHLLLHQPRQFFANHHESKRLNRKRKERAELDSLRPTPRRLIRDVLTMLVHHVDESNPNPMLRRAQESKDVRKKSPVNNTPRLRRVVISEDFVRDLLLSFGEIEAADDDELITEMVIVAGGDGTVLDELAFARALTSDILAWTCGMEDGINETFVDVWGFDPVAKNEYDLGRAVLAAGADVVADAADLAIATGITAANVATEAVDVVKPAAKSQGSSKTSPGGKTADQVTSPNKEGGEGQEGGIKFVHTAHYIDYVCDSFRSLLFQMALYVFYLFSAAIGMSMIGTLNMSGFIKCEPSFWCNLGTQVWQWAALALVLCASGVIIIAPISMANDPYNRSWKKTSLSVLWLLAITLTTFFAIFFYEKGIPHDEDGKLNDLERLVQGFYFQLSIRVYLAFGLVLCLYMLRFMFQMCVSREFIRNNRVLRALTLPHGIRRATDTKIASTRKINAVLANAVKMHFRDWNGVKVTAAERFTIEPERSIRVGGLVWSWWNLLTRKLSTHHGIWLPSRLAIAQECQVIVLLFSIVVLVWGSDSLASDAERKRAELQAEPDGPLKDEALRFVPEPYVIKATFAFGGFFAISVGAILVLVYIPSTVATILALRCGKIATFRDQEHFFLNREASDRVFYNVANATYALLGSAALFFVMFGGILFLFLWPVSSETMLILLSWCLGLTLTIFIKTLVMMLSRKEFHQALIRKRVKASNYNALAMECWQLGVGGGTLLSRLCQFLFAAAFWIGRIDVVFLDEDVSLFGYSFDYVPINYRTELVVHEVHKHPWINRLGGMFLMRMKHGQDFSSVAGAKWRLLFTLSLFPWLARYRKKRGGGDDGDSDDDDELMALSSINTPNRGTIERLKRRIAAREGLQVGDRIPIGIFRKKDGLHVEKEEVQESEVQESPMDESIHNRTGFDVLMG